MSEVCCVTCGIIVGSWASFIYYWSSRIREIMGILYLSKVPPHTFFIFSEAYASLCNCIRWVFSCVVLCFGLFVIVLRAISREMGPTWDPIYYGPFMDPICGILAVWAYVELILACSFFIQGGGKWELQIFCSFENMLLELDRQIKVILYWQ